MLRSLKNSNITELLIVSIILSLVTSIGFTIVGNGINILLVVFMIIAVLYNLIKIDFDKKSNILYVLIVLLLISSLIHYDSFRINSWGYSLLFIMYLITLVSLLKRNEFRLIHYVDLLKFLVQIYFVCLIIQQVMYLAGFEIVFNHINTNAAIGKFNSLATEPSYAARFLVIIFISYIRMMELVNKRIYLFADFVKDYVLWLMFLYQIVTMNSSFGYMLILLFLLRFVTRKSILLIISLFIMFISIAIKYEVTAFQRLYNVIIAFCTLNEVDILKADHSAALRIVPTIMYIKDFSFISLNSWLGYGADYSRNYIPTVVNGINEGQFLGGFFPVFLYNYGLLNTYIMFRVVFKVAVVKIVCFDTFILTICLAASPFNSQLFWGIIVLYSVNKFFIIREVRNQMIQQYV